MEYDPYNAEDKQQRTRAIIITSVIAVLVLGIAIWAIIAIVSSRNNNTAISNDNTTVAVDEGSNKKGTTDQTTNYPADNTNVPNTEGVTAQVQPQTPAPAAASQLTTTGPEDLLPLALVAGSAAMFISSRSLAKREA